MKYFFYLYLFGSILLSGNVFADTGDLFLKNANHCHRIDDAIKFKVITQETGTICYSNELYPNGIFKFSNTDLGKITSSYLAILIKNVTKDIDYQPCLTVPYHKAFTAMVIFGWHDGKNFDCIMGNGDG